VASPAAAEGPRLLRAIYGATFFIRFAFGLTVSVFAAYVTGHFTGLSAPEVGLVGVVTGAAPVGEFSTVLLSGIQADHYGRFPVLLTGMGGAAVLFLVISFTRDAPALGISNLVFGVASGAILASSLAVIGDRAASDVRGHAMGLFDSMNLLGWVLGFAAGFALLGSLPNGTLPWVFRLGAAALVAGLLFALVERRGHVERASPVALRLAEVADAVLRREVLLLALPWVVIYMLIGAAFAFLGSAGSGVGIAPWELSALIGGGGMLLLVTQPYFGRLADRYGRFRLMAVGSAGFIGVLLLLIAITAWGARPVLLGGLGVSALAALAYGPAALAALADVSRTFNRGTTMAVYSLVISVGMILGLLGSSLLFASFQTRGIDLFFGLIAAGLAILTVLRGLDLRSGSGHASTQVLVPGAPAGVPPPSDAAERERPREP
jgi:MFS family permease